MYPFPMFPSPRATPRRQDYYDPGGSAVARLVVAVLAALALGGVLEIASRHHTIENDAMLAQASPAGPVGE